MDRDTFSVISPTTFLLYFVHLYRNINGFAPNFAQRRKGSPSYLPATIFGTLFKGVCSVGVKICRFTLSCPVTVNTRLVLPSSLWFIVTFSVNSSVCVTCVCVCVCLFVCGRVYIYSIIPVLHGMTFCLCHMSSECSTS